MNDFDIRAYQPQDTAAIAALLRRRLPLEAITEESFARRVLLDPNFDPEGALVATESNGGIVGFILAIARQRPLEDAPPDNNRGWITLLAVDDMYGRRGIGGALLTGAEGYLKLHQRHTCWISPYAPNYWTPGVDEAAYTEGLDWLKRRGYKVMMRPLSMSVDLGEAWGAPGWSVERERTLKAAGVEITPFTPDTILPLTDLLREEFPGDWQRYLRETMLDITLGRRPADVLWVAMEHGRAIGFAQSEGERFGPFGVRSGERGKGVGAVLMFKTLLEMRRRGTRRAWFMWTNDAAADRIYRSAGFAETRRFAVLRREL